MQLYSYNLKTGSILRLVRTDVDDSARHASWFSDGRRIIYAYRRVDTYELWTMTSLGDNEYPIYTSGDELSNSNPIWSPDGEFILFSQQTVGEFNFPSLYSLRRNGDNVPLRIPLGVLSAEDAHYSPDGVWLAYESGGDRGYHVYYSSPSGGNQARITKDVTFDDFDPVWRPVMTTP